MRRLLILSVLLLSYPLDAQIEVIDEAVLGPGDELAVPYEPLTLAVTESGVTWVTLPNGELPRRFSGDGSFLGSVGSVGEGPAEFRRAYEVVALPGDSILVLDGENGRASVFTADGRYHRTITGLPQIGRLHVFEWPGTVLGWGIIPSPERAGFPLHWLDFSGTGLRIGESFGSDGDYSFAQRGKLFRRLGAANGDAAIIAHQLSYQFFTLDRDGDVAWRYDEAPSWFQNESPLSFGSPDYAPPPWVDGVTSDAAGNVWAFFRIPRASWRDEWVGLDWTPDRELSPSDVPAPDRLWRSRVQVLSEGAGVVAEFDFDGVVIDVDKGPTALVFSTTEREGEPIARIIRLRLGNNRP